MVGSVRALEDFRFEMNAGVMEGRNMFLEVLGIARTFR
jgi:hypothetical protein